MKRSVCLFFALIVTLIASAGACAAANVSDTYQYVTDSTTYTAAANGSLTVNLYLQETANTGASLLSSEGGLANAGILITQNAGTSSFAQLKLVTPNTAAFTGPEFVNSVQAGSASFSEGSPFTSGVTATAVDEGNGVTVSRVFLGTVTVTTAAGGTATQFTLAPYATGNPAVGNTVTNTNFYDLDVGTSAESITYQNTGAGLYSFTVNEAPEPTSALLYSPIALLLLRRRSNVKI